MEINETKQVLLKDKDVYKRQTDGGGATDWPHLLYGFLLPSCNF